MTDVRPQARWWCVDCGKAHKARVCPRLARATQTAHRVSQDMEETVRQINALSDALRTSLGIPPHVQSSGTYLHARLGSQIVNGTKYDAAARAKAKQRWDAAQREKTKAALRVTDADIDAIEAGTWAIHSRRAKDAEWLVGSYLGSYLDTYWRDTAAQEKAARASYTTPPSTPAIINTGFGSGAGHSSAAVTVNPGKGYGYSRIAEEGPEFTIPLISIFLCVATIVVVIVGAVIILSQSVAPAVPEAPAHIIHTVAGSSW